MIKRIFASLFILSAAAQFAHGAIGNGKQIPTGIIRIGLAKQIKTAAFEITGPTLVTDLSNGKKFKIPEAAAFTVNADDDKNITIASYTFSFSIRMTPFDRNDRLKYDGKSYRGSIVIRNAGNTSLNVIEELGVEEYLYGVLPIEMSKDWPIEALKAQAVAARTYSLYNIDQYKNDGFDVHSDVRSQAYVGASKDSPRILEAVQATAGLVLTYEDKLIPAFYHANCGGCTSPPVWGGDAIEPFHGVTCGYCDLSRNYDWEVLVPDDKLISFMKTRGHAVKRVKYITISKRNKAHRAIKLNITTDKGTFEENCNDLRIFIGGQTLKSSYIKKIYRTKGGFMVQGKGYGHGVGMCQ
ncbi:MAG: SpoIID/LytB domain-containing protein, partial [Elusimicrobiaceae bacterium]